ncbi:MAG TPA: hypothetical protein VGT98_11620 [Candidatus Elarobacter sp.]|nr:hypothetical protein [Candidatus Elarobacter sp.]HEV2738018.1 hypothetical protein [Candidatus Elarobacter sp.]
MPNIEIIVDGVQCPSADPRLPDAKVLGIVRDAEAAVAVEILPELVDPQPLIDLIPAELPVRSILRFAGSCQESRCAHFGAGKCGLATRVVAQMPEVVDRIARCAIRPRCRWWRQEGIAACRRCPQVLTEPLAPTDLMVSVATPSASGASA